MDFLIGQVHMFEKKVRIQSGQLNICGFDLEFKLSEKKSMEAPPPPHGGLKSVSTIPEH